MFSLPLPKPIRVHVMKPPELPGGPPQIAARGFAHSMIVFTSKPVVHVPGQAPTLEDINALVFVTFDDGSGQLVPLNALHWGTP